MHGVCVGQVGREVEDSCGDGERERDDEELDAEGELELLGHGDYHPFMMRSTVGTNLLPRGEHTDILDHGTR